MTEPLLIPNEDGTYSGWKDPSVRKVQCPGLDEETPCQRGFIRDPYNGHSVKHAPCKGTGEAYVRDCPSRHTFMGCVSDHPAECICNGTGTLPAGEPDLEVYKDTATWEDGRHEPEWWYIGCGIDRVDGPTPQAALQAAQEKS